MTLQHNNNHHWEYTDIYNESLGEISLINLVV